MNYGGVEGGGFFVLGGRKKEPGALIEYMATYRYFLLNTNKFSDFVNHFVLNQGAVHIKHGETLVSPEDAFLLQYYLYVPLPLKTPYHFMFAQVCERQIFGVRQW